MTRLVLIHGRAQENKDPDRLKADWVAALRQGLASTGHDLPIHDDDIRFPYYGQALDDLRRQVEPAKAAPVVVRGDGTDDDADPLRKLILQELVTRAADRAVAQGLLTAIELDQLTRSDVNERGVLNWGPVRRVLQWLDANVPGSSGATMAMVTNDVHDYLRNPGLRDRIETGVNRAIEPGVETVVVGHSLGSVVAYNLLRREGPALGWRVPLLVTIGSPLAVTALRQLLAPLTYPTVADRWFNAMDPNDVVALQPLRPPHFSVEPIENHVEVHNFTPNRHGIEGYLSDPLVARRIVEALA